MNKEKYFIKIINKNYNYKINWFKKFFHKIIFILVNELTKNYYYIYIINY